MPEQRTSQEQYRLLADIAELYYLEGKNQEEIGHTIGLTRSMVSRLLSEAKQKGIVDVHIHRPLESDYELEAILLDKFKLHSAYVVVVRSNESSNALKYVGGAAAQHLHRYLTQDMVLGVTWGTSVCATVDEFESERPMRAKVVQLVGSLSARIYEYDGHSIVLRLAHKLGGEGYFLDAPFFCQTAEMARNLREAQGVHEVIQMGKQVEVSLVGIGSVEPEHSSFYRAGTVPLEEILSLKKRGAVGAVCGLHFDIEGQEVCSDFCERLVGIQHDDLLAIPVRIGIAGGPHKIQSILGALRGNYINVLVTDNVTARQVLELAER
ncbi:MAG: sugar-binding transcriptional regulator [Anaerolineaceae bacterium]|jgi:DNA-binding transcriptional regulator LsrR (DeoR family)